LDTKSGLELPTPLDLENPDEFDEPAIRRDLGGTDPFPRAVGPMIFDLIVHGLGPTVVIEGQSLSTGLGIGGQLGGGESHARGGEERKECTPQHAEGTPGAQGATDGRAVEATVAPDPLITNVSVRFRRNVGRSRRESLRFWVQEGSGLGLKPERADRR
jgi:hypothetical protein